MKFKEEFLVTIIILGMVFLSLLPSLYSFFNRYRLPAHRQWLYIHNYLYDHNSYLSKMKQGEQGRWTVVEKYTHELHSGSLYQIFYLLLGKAGHFLGLLVEETHFWSRIFFGAAWLLVIYLFLSAFFKEKFWRIACFLTILFSAGYPRHLPWGWAAWYDWWSEFNVFVRPTFLPHFLVGHITIALALLFFVRALDKRNINRHSEFNSESINWRFTFLSGLMVLAAGIVLPPSLLAIWGSLTIFSMSLLLVRRSELFLKALKISFLIFLISLPSVLYFLSLFSHYPWKEIADWEKAHPFWADMKMYAYSQGTSFFLALLAIGVLVVKALVAGRNYKTLSVSDYKSTGLRLCLKTAFFNNFSRREREGILMFLPAGWFLTHLLGTWFLNQTRFYLPMRFWQVASYVPAGILTVWLVKEATGFVKKKTPPIVPIILISLISLTFLPGIYLNWQYLINRESQLLAYDVELVPYPNQEHYPLKTLMAAINWLAENSKPEEIVLSHITAGNFIPAYSGNTVYIGNTTQTVKIGEKYKRATEFFSGKMGSEQAKEFLKGNKITYIFWGPQERGWGGKINQYSFLKPVYKNKDVIIFAVHLI